MATATSDFDVPRTGGQRGRPDRVRTRAFAAARRHSVLVRVLRLLLPLGALGCLALYVVGGPLSLSIGDGSLSIDEIKLDAKNLQMSNPVYEGYTDDNGRYTVRAVSATQQLAKPDLVKLQKVTAELTQADGRKAQMAAATGEIDTKKEILKLGGGIAIASSDGMNAKLKTATLRLKTKRILSSEPVAVEMPSGTVSSRSLDIDTETKRILFKSKVVTRLVPPPKAATAKPAPEKRAGLASVAAFGDGPIDITSDLLDIRDTEKIAMFSGHVVASQNGATYAAPQMIVTYTGDSALTGVEKSSGDETGGAASAKSAGTEIAKIESKGGVVIKTADGRSAAGEWSIYDRAAGTMQLGGGVTLTDTDNQLTGDLLIVDLEKGISRFPPGGRVKGLMGGAEAKKDKSKAAKKKLKPAKAGPADLTSFTADSGGPMDIEADSLEVDDAKGAAVFRGDVIAHRGAQQIKTSILSISYVASGTSALPEGQDNIRRIIAEGDVVISAPDDQVVRGDKLDYDAKTSIITITGNVTTTKGKNVIKGDKLVVNLETGESSFDTDPGELVQGAKKRIKMLINPDELPQSPN